MNRFFSIVLLMVIIINTIRYFYYIFTGPIEAYYFVMLAINLAGLGLGIYYLFFQKKKQRN
ncbi:hypothetical protein ACQCU1_20750 [Sutcliffiella horikoshii]|uniref:Uncharacterized protein n=1 Tax=Sutcliffiella horikoshii TaxID=79883 RepID=A0ABN4Z8X4_9BACI|nr:MULTISPECIES: hypothetical protein [Bacillaceae]ART74825.1 hypothetical protein B4U37_01630 [Sutcliffiella horikoshii]UAL47720.1 hypothetical protein K7887_01715 [Sutcliffiella horikoshii]